ncbi:MAG: DUF2065 domain-containing protein [Maricaulaceae bacterium]|nr:DUF2065 domain-containing protein [Maricaulaceae bacterium]
MLEALLIGLGVAMALEGAAYALAPGAMKRFMAMALQSPDSSLRIAGVIALAGGVALVAFMLR